MQNILGKWYTLFFYVLNLVMVDADLCYMYATIDRIKLIKYKILGYFEKK